MYRPASSQPGTAETLARRTADQVSASTAGCGRARRGRPYGASFLLDHTAGKITPPITKTTTRPRISSAP